MSRYIVFGFLAAALATTGASAQEFVSFGAAKGALYTPSNPSNVAFLVIHRTSSDLDHIATVELPKRGYRVLGMDTYCVDDETAVDFDLIALDIRAGVRFLRKQPGVTKVVLLGSSGGGQTTAYYQATAKSEDKADGIVFADAHVGISVTNLRALNPLESDLDPFDERNGYNPDGDSTYSSQFVDRYSRAQSKRMNELITKAKNASGGGDDSFVVRHAAARLSDLSTGVQPGTLNQRKLIKNDGSIRTQIITTVRVSDPGLKEDDDTFARGALDLTVDSFLRANSIASTHALNGIDWCSDPASTICSARKITVPALVLVATGHYFIRDGEQIFTNLGSQNKDFFAIEGMKHGLTPCGACSAQTGVSYANATRNAFDRVASWVKGRF